MSAQPAIYELPFDVGELPRPGLCSQANSWGRNSTIIDALRQYRQGQNLSLYTAMQRGSSGPSFGTNREPMHLGAFHLVSSTMPCPALRGAVRRPLY